MKAEIVTMTPERAKALLELNTNNRPLSEAIVSKYARLMKECKWHENGESIILTDRPRLGSGQHRLHACIRAGYTWRAVIVSGVADAAFPTLDAGKGRTGADVLGTLGHKQTHSAASVLTAIRGYKSGLKSYFQRVGLSPAEVAELAQAYPDYQHVLPLTYEMAKHGLPKQSTLAAAFYCVREIDPALVDNFRVRFIQGVGLAPMDPLHHLRTRLLSDRALTRSSTAVLTAKAFALALRGEQIRCLKLIDAEEMTAITR
jgi:hypothetical protein